MTQDSEKNIVPILPLISIITIVLNGEKHIRKAIESVLDQSYENIEYIIIDGGSVDGTMNILNEYSDKIDYLISEKDSGISDAFNKGISKANGDIIGIINADDWYEKDAIEKVINNYNKADVLYGNVLYWDGEKKSYLFKADHNLLKFEMSVNHPAVFIKKNVYHRLGNFSRDYKQAMDYELLLRLFINDVRFFYIDSHLANMSLKGISDTNWIKGCKEVLRAKNSILGNRPFHYAWFLKQILTISFSRFLNKIGLSNLVGFYRKYSPVKKIIPHEAE